MKYEFLILPNGTNAYALYPLLQMLHKMGVIDYTSQGSWQGSGYKTYMNLPLDDKNKKYGMANCLLIDFNLAPPRGGLS